jgi:glutathione S-transferase
LDKELSGKKWITGENISLADIVVSYVLSPLFLLSFDKDF